MAHGSSMKGSSMKSTFIQAAGEAAAEM